MITRFGSLFAGHVDLDDEGLDGTPVNDRWLSDDYLATVFPKSEAIARLMDRTGYDTFWLAEHRAHYLEYDSGPVAPGALRGSEAQNPMTQGDR